MERLPALPSALWTPLAVGLWVDEPVPLQHGQARGTLFNTYLPVPPPPPKEGPEHRLPKSGGRRFTEKLNLRDLMWLLLVAALLYGWFLDHQIMVNIVRKSHPDFGRPLR